MYSWFLVIIVVISVISLLLFVAIRQNIKHVTDGYLKILGTENKELVKPSSLFILKVLYFLALMILPLLFYIFTFPNG